MKKLAGLVAAATLALAFQACDSSASLAKEIAGGWSGTPQSLFDADASRATIIETYSFAGNDSVKNGGTVVISALMSVTGAISGTEGIITPVSVTASGYAMITGTWQAVSADKIELTLDTGNITVKVDPDAVVVNADMLTGTSAPANMATLKPQLAQSITAQLNTEVARRYKPLETLTGVSIKDHNILRFKLDRTPYTLSRQPD